MSMNLNQKLATRLAAPGGAFSADGERLYLLTVEGDKEDGYYLSDKCSTNLNTISEKPIASGVRKDITVAYLLSPSASDEEDERLVCFYVDEADTLKLSTFNPGPGDDEDEDAGSQEGSDDEEYGDEDEEGWEEGEFDGIKPPSVHLDGQVSACFTADGGTLVFFQDSSGAIESIQHRNGEWSRLGQLPAKPKPGSPHYPLVVDDELYFFYAGEDLNLHYLTRKADDTQWTDHIFENAKAGEHASRLTVGYDPKTGKLTAYVLANDTLTAISQEGDRQDLVKKEGGKFVALTSAECGYVAVGLNVSLRFSVKIDIGLFRRRRRCRY